MKTTKIRLFATMIALAAVTLASTAPATAQRRETHSRKTENRQRNESRTKSAVQRKSTFKNYDSQRRSSGNSSVRARRQEPQKSATRSSQSRSQNRSSVQRPERTATRASAQRGSSTVRRSTPKSGEIPSRSNHSVTREKSRTVPDYNTRSNSYPNRHSTVQERNRTSNSGSRNQRYDSSTRRSSANRSGNVTRRPDTRNKREMYNLDRNDRRYKTSRDYKGSSNYWTAKYRPERRHYTQHDRDFYRHYNYRKYNHWNHNWENYRWNLNSWIDYYNGYNPYSYRYQRYYYHHPIFGDVIRKFVYRPVVFFHNHHRYYCYDGHFFRYRRGIGYILVDIPFGMVFDYLPRDYDRVYVNGYLYFRVGNLFFENTDLGFRLVHYPERYYAYNDNYINGGYHFDDDLYY